MVTPTRYLRWAGEVIATRTTGGAVTWLVNDHHGTPSVAVAAGNQAVTTRRDNPFGVPRGPVPVWPNGLGFAGGDRDATGLVHSGLSYNDPVSGETLRGPGATA